jgi:streptogramin lyase
MFAEILLRTRTMLGLTRFVSLAILAVSFSACTRAGTTTSEGTLASFGGPLREAPDSASARWLNLLPDGEEKRRFILDCTGCHQFDTKIARLNGRARTQVEWEDAIRRMLGFAGATTGFPVIAEGRDARATATWLVRHLSNERALVGDADARVTAGQSGFTVTEFLMPVAGDLPHDVAVDSEGQVIVTGMFSHAMHVLDPASGRVRSEPIPIERANPRAVEIDSLGNWWVVLGGPMRIARRSAPGIWNSWEVGVYPHSLAVDPRGRVWFNGHFTRDPELVGAVDASTGAVRVDTMPLHPRMGSSPGGPIPYEIRLAPDGRLWMGELQGNRLLALDPVSRQTDVFEMPLAWSGPRRFDIDARGMVWIPAYAANALVRLDPSTRRFTEYPLPIRDAVPYVVRVDHRRGAIWIGASAADVIFRFDPSSARFTTIPLPSRGALVRHLALDSRNGDLWVAYGASPGIPARVARVSTSR